WCSHDHREGVELRPIGAREAGEIERTVTAFARETNGGLIVAAGAAVAINRELIIKLAARYRLTAVYPYRAWFQSLGSHLSRFLFDHSMVCRAFYRVRLFRRTVPILYLER